jgi:hypothetical protein
MNIKTVLLGFACCFFNQVNAQSFIQQNTQGGNSFANDISGRPLYLKTEYRSQGSPYLFEDYCVAEVTAQNGKVYEGIRVKININENKLLYMNKDGTEMIAISPVQKVRLMPHSHVEATHGEMILLSPGKAINIGGSPIYQLLVEGKANLYKQIIIDYTDSKGYSEATITRVFNRKERFFARMPGVDTSLQKVEKNKTALPALFPNYQETISTFISTQKLNCKSEKDLVAVFRFFNALE